VFVTSGSARLAVDVAGDPAGPPVLLLHAGVNDRRSWAPVVSVLGPLFRTVAYDRRGYGLTEYTPGASDRSDVGDAVAVLDALEVTRAAVVGASMGGRLAIDLALAHPERVSALVLIGAGVRGMPDLVPMPPALQALSDAIDAAEEAGDLDEVNRLEAHVWLDGWSAPEGRVGGDTRALFLEMNGIELSSPDPGPDADRPSAWERLDTITVPTTVIVGDLDLPDVVAAADAIADRVPGAEVHHIAGTAHLPHLEAEPTCLQLVVEALSS
jgi:pimeloyl-ACP methyl ester carboxylesterase